MTLPERDHMIAVAAASGKRLGVRELCFLYPPLVKARELLRNGDRRTTSSEVVVG